MEPESAPDQQEVMVLGNHMGYAWGVERVPTKPGCWDYNNVWIYEFAGDKVGRRLGGYQRNYSAFYKTFYPFRWEGRDYALYSRNYTATRVMSLPDCRDLGGEERDSFGFCPTGFYVPVSPYTGESGGFGFVSGCVWGDDSSWKVEFLDLRKVAEGVLTRTAAYGYAELASRNDDLSKAIEVDWDENVDESYVEVQAVKKVRVFRHDVNHAWTRNELEKLKVRLEDGDVPSALDQIDAIVLMTERWDGIEPWPKADLKGDK
jgi:hypothetical protein